ncbi:hypothetical protein KCP75_15595 [Salmonella enterica subsp. enterica]|nr:hypothetical protein KCP75_15595 [Salmonella enterica subsp. enterica]
MCQTGIKAIAEVAFRDFSIRDYFQKRWLTRAVYCKSLCTSRQLPDYWGLAKSAVRKSGVGRPQKRDPLLIQFQI